jgi:hypothetical protein
MHHLIASYLFQNKTCPLPGMGTLFIKPAIAESNFLDKTFRLKQPEIVFETKESDANNLLDFIAFKTNNSVLQSIELLGQYCNKVKAALIADNTATIEGVGNFNTDNTGNFIFKPNNLPVAFLQPVTAVRVIRPLTEHNILVGDKETTNTLMNEYFNEDVLVKKNRWWIWAIVLAVIALLAILIYTNNANLSSMAGSAMPIN